MASLVDLPTELLLKICQAMDDFDDVLRLRRCCRRMHEIVNVQEYRSTILAAILNNLDATWFSTVDAIEAIAKQIPNHNQNIHDAVLRWQSLKALQQAASTFEPFEEDYEELVEALRNDDANYYGLPLIWAASRGIETLVLMMLNEVEDVNAIGDVEGTPLGLAAKNGHQRVVRMLLDKGVQPEQKGQSILMTPLAWAVLYGHAGIVDLLLDRGADIESRDRGGMTPLCFAAHDGNVMMVKKLLENGAQAMTRIANGKTPLHIAARRRNEEVLSMLLEHCSLHDCQEILTSRDEDYGATLLHEICGASCNVSFVRHLLAEGVKPCVFDSRGTSPLTRALRNEVAPPVTEDEDELFEKVRLLSKDAAVILTPTDQYEKTSLHLAAERPDPRIMIWLLEHQGRSGLNQQDAFGNTPLLVALRKNNTKVIESLLSLPDIDLNCRQYNGQTVLHVAAQRCTPIEISSLLRLNPALLNAVDKNGRTPLLEAFRARQLENCEYLLKINADISIADSFGQDPLRWATQEAKEIKFYELLMDRDLVPLDHQGNTLLHNAVRGHSIQRVTNILESPDINLRNQNELGDTALHTAVQNGTHAKTEEIIQVLLQADKIFTLARIPNNSGKTALDLALERGREDSIEILVQPRWNSTAGLEWDSESIWIQKWSDQPWYSDLLRIIGAARFDLAAQTQLLVDQCGGPPLTISMFQTRQYMANMSVGLSDRNPVFERLEGSYCGSRTWFEVCISKSSQADQVISSREVQRNIYNSSQPRQHTVIWDVRDPTPGLKEWLRSVEGGDILHINPMASHCEWWNCVQEVAVTVFYKRS
ncbi:hypothetical protein APSETT444_006518 [Aspergillus pseudonomiae]